MPGLVESSPGGIRILSGGTRNQVKLSRPWQPPFLVDDSETCPFATRPQNELARFGEGSEAWRGLGNSATPFSFHNLLIPAVCWDVEQVKRLGGVGKIEEMLRLVKAISGKRTSPVLVCTHVGSLAGQNVGHLHWHVLSDLNYAPGMPTTDGLSEGCLVFRHDVYRVVSGGVRAGQCFIIPTGEARDFLRLAEVLDRIVSLFSEKFCSEQGEPPHYQVALKFVEGCFQYGFVVPILNHWGGTEYFALVEGAPLVLPWPHAVTAEFLRS